MDGGHRREGPLETWFSWSDVERQQGEVAYADAEAREWVDPAPACSQVLTAYSLNKNPAYDATRQALSAARGLCERHPLPATDDEGRARTGVVTFAVVVTTAPLWTVRLLEEGELVIEAVERFDVWTDSGDGSGSLRPVMVLHENAVRRYARSLIHHW